MALLSTAGASAVVSTLQTNSPYVSLHTASPSTTGANETSGGSYARQSVTWSSGANSNAITVPIAASTTITHVGFWSAVSAGTYCVGAALGASVSSGASAANVTFAIGALTLAAA